MIKTIVTSAVGLATSLLGRLLQARSKAPPKLDPPLSKLESEKLAESMLERARKMAEEEKARKRREGGKP